MVLPASQFFSDKLPSISTVDRPMFTSIPQGWGVSRIGSKVPSYRKLWQQLKQTPELVATLSVPITDIIGDRPHWTDPEGNELSKEELKRARRFWMENRGKDTLKAMLFDAFLTGDGFIWKGSPSDSEIKEAAEKVVNALGKNLDILQSKELITKVAKDEVLKLPKVFDYVASSSVEILHDEFEISGYKQTAFDKTALFSPEEIIHHRYMNLDGKVQGFSPAEALVAEITLLWLVKGNMLSFMRNGGSPDKVFILPKELANSKNHQYLINTLQKYKRVENMHGNLVFTGELEIKDLQGNPKDLEYKDLALYITSNLAYAYRIPVTRIPYLIGTASSKGDSGGLSESGYWNSIGEMQDTIEDLLNLQLFEMFGWHIQLPRKYKQDEVREAQTASMNADTVTKYQEILSKNKKQLTVQKILRLLSFNEDEIEDQEEDPLMENGLMNQNMLSNDQVMPEQDAQKRANAKRNVANQEGSKAAAVNP